MHLKFILLCGASKQLNNSSCLCPLLKQVTVWRVTKTNFVPVKKH